MRNALSRFAFYPNNARYKPAQSPASECGPRFDELMRSEV